MSLEYIKFFPANNGRSQYLTADCVEKVVEGVLFDQDLLRPVSDAIVEKDSNILKKRKEKLHIAYATSEEKSNNLEKTYAALEGIIASSEADNLRGATVTKLLYEWLETLYNQDCEINKEPEIHGDRFSEIDVAFKEPLDCYIFECKVRLSTNSTSKEDRDKLSRIRDADPHISAGFFVFDDLKQGVKASNHAVEVDDLVKPKKELLNLIC